MTDEQFKDHDNRLRKLEDFILSKMDRLLDLTDSFKDRIETLEEHDKEFMAMVHTTCTLKDKEIEKSRVNAIDISCTHADSNHKQTMGLLAGTFALFISALIYFNYENGKRAIDIQKHETQIENIAETLEKIDGKMDRIYSHIQKEDTK